MRDILENYKKQKLDWALSLCETAGSLAARISFLCGHPFPSAWPPRLVRHDSFRLIKPHGFNFRRSFLLIYIIIIIFLHCLNCAAHRVPDRLLSASSRNRRHIESVLP